MYDNTGISYLWNNIVNGWVLYIDVSAETKKEKEMNDKFVKELQDKFLGKRISVPWTNTTGFGTKIPNDTVVGICEFIGPNPLFPSWGLQVTIGRMPITNVDYTKIKLV